jgi:hypothetical protein
MSGLAAFARLRDTPRVPGGLLAVENADAIPWLIAAAIVLAAWSVLFAVVATATMPKLPDAGPETMDAGSEPPAVANFLRNRWEVTTSAIPATLVDLAARGHVGIGASGDGENLIRLLPQRATSRTTTNGRCSRSCTIERATGPFLRTSSPSATGRRPSAGGRRSALGDRPGP